MNQYTCHRCDVALPDDECYMAVDKNGGYLNDHDYCQSCANIVSQAQSNTKESVMSLDQLFAGISQYPLQNVLQRTMQSMVSEIARAQHMSDRVQLGDQAVADANGQRPGPDQLEYEPQLTERQAELLMRCADDEIGLMDALAEFADFYKAQFGDKPQYGLMDRNEGRPGKPDWQPITDFDEAVKHEYNRAHQAYQRRQGNAQADADTVASAKHLLAQRRQDAQQRRSRL